jgi:hypothetical protein
VLLVIAEAQKLAKEWMEKYQKSREWIREYRK